MRLTPTLKARRQVVILAVGLVILYTFLTKFQNRTLDGATYTAIIQKFFSDDEFDLSMPSSSPSQSIRYQPVEDFNQKFQNFYSDIIVQMASKRNQLPKFTINKDYREGLDKASLESYIQFDNADLITAQQVHQDIFKKIPNSFPKDLHKGDGIVLVGGGKFTWLATLSIKSIRTFGSKLPIEILIPTKKDYEADLCERIFPALDAHCVKLWEVLGPRVSNKVTFSGFQYKVLALITSSFENVILLDSDNILVTNPDRLLTSIPFKKHGLITWPDYWTRTTSPHLYTLVGQAIDESAQVRQGVWPLTHPISSKPDTNYHDLKGTMPDLSTESGQLLISKRNHVKTLMLSLFYNIHGPNFFYPLLSQWAIGEGDKDTFILAANRAGEDFYQVKSEIQSFGWFQDGQYEGVSMGQRDLIQDYDQFEALKKENPDLDGEAKFSAFDKTKVSVFTIHANHPKLDPLGLRANKGLVNNKGERIRLYSDIAFFLKHVPKNEGSKRNDDLYDFELIQFENMRILLCELNMDFSYFRGVDRAGICQFVEDHLEFLKTAKIGNQ